MAKCFLSSFHPEGDMYSVLKQFFFYSCDNLELKRFVFGSWSDGLVPRAYAEYRGGGRMRRKRLLASCQTGSREEAHTMEDREQRVKSKLGTSYSEFVPLANVYPHPHTTSS